MSEQIILGKKTFVESSELQEFIKYAIGAHAGTNHFYDDYLPYEFHLRMVVKNGKDYLYLLEETLWENVIKGLWGHDLIEDARENYNGVKKRSNTWVAEVIRACTNYTRGRDRNERMPDFVYDEIRATPGALFVKLCDRMANVQYSKMTGSSMFQRYKKEHEHFKKMLYTPGVLEPMWEYLELLFVTEKA